MLEKFNSFMEKWMAFVTPACLLTGVLFPDIAKHGVPYVTYAFAFMTFIGALKSRFRDVADVFKRPLPLILMLLILHVLGPVAACGLGHLLFPGNMNYITGMVLEFSVPAAVISLMLIVLMIGLTVISFPAVRKKMNPKKWKQIQRSAYVFYGLLYVHIMLINIPYARMGLHMYAVNVLVYSIVFAGYAAMRIRKWVLTKNPDADSIFIKKVSVAVSVCAVLVLSLIHI